MNLCIGIRSDLDDWRGYPQAAVDAWAHQTLKETCHTSEGSIDIGLIWADALLSRDLNARYRNKDQPTNVLAFPYEPWDPKKNFYLGDLVLCVPVLIEEAQTFNIPLEHHTAHLFVHGFLHLLGYDHINPEEAVLMEALEDRILQAFGIVVCR